MEYPIRDQRLIIWKQYLELEASSEERFEYHDGQIVSLAAATLRHNKIVVNTATHLKIQLDGSGCDVFTESVKLFRHQSERYLYPDIMVTCNPLDQQSNAGIRNPFLIIEVMSDSSARADQNFKLMEYRAIPSLKHYLLITQETMLVQHYRRMASGGWEFLTYSVEQDTIGLGDLTVSVSLSAIYQGVRFGSEGFLAQEEAAAYGKQEIQ